MQRIVIFGATSSIATACARQWAGRGASLFLVGRNPDRLAALTQDIALRLGPGARVASQQADLDHIDDHPALLQAAIDSLGDVDLALIAHGTLPDQAACAASVPQTLAEIHTNALSPVSLMTLLAQHFEGRGSGTLAVIGSVAGDRGRQSNYVYGAAKGMVNLFADGLRNRLHRRGVRVLTIKPGFVDTPMTAAFAKGPLWASPERVAAGIVGACARGGGGVYLPGFWWGIMFVIRHIPDVIFRRLRL